MSLSPVRNLSRPRQLGLVGLIVAALTFGGVVEMRGAFLQNRWTDLTVYLRAAWAVRTGENPYRVTDEKGLHYHYPPLFAILLTPFADPGPGARGPETGVRSQESGVREDGYPVIPFAVCVGGWYLLSLVFLIRSCHLLASVLESDSCLLTPEQVVRWWARRIVPALACLPAIGYTLALGQVTLLLLWLLAEAAAGLVRGRHFTAGLWLAGAVCLKVIPAFLLLLPLWRRDRRCLAGCVAGLAVGLAVIPAVALGPTRAVACYGEWADELFRPALGLGGDGHARTEELLAVTATHNPSVMAVLHNLSHPDPATRPPEASPAIRRIHWLIGGTLTAITLLAAGWRRGTGVRRQESGVRKQGTDTGFLTPDSCLQTPSSAGRRTVLLLGALTINMLILSPVGHPHYLALLVLPLSALRAPSRSNGLGWMDWLCIAAIGLPGLPPLTSLFDWGAPLAAALVVWAACVRELWLSRIESATVSAGEEFARQAA